LTRRRSAAARAVKPSATSTVTGGPARLQASMSVACSLTFLASLHLRQLNALNVVFEVVPYFCLEIERFIQQLRSFVEVVRNVLHLEYVIALQQKFLEAVHLHVHFY